MNCDSKCTTNVIFMNLKSHTINIWCKIGKNSDFREDLKIEKERNICDGQCIMAPSMWYKLDIAWNRKSVRSVSAEKEHELLYGRTVGLVQLGYNKMRCTPTFSENGIFYAIIYLYSYSKAYNHQSYKTLTPYRVISYVRLCTL